ncbi:hypothetical protein ACQKWADRAFT_308063 [Trichoderma austrokoningii]
MKAKHPVAKRADRMREKKGKGRRPTSRPRQSLKTKLERARDLAPAIPRPKERFPVAYPTPRRLPSKQEPREAQMAYQEEMQKLLPSTMVVYSDGSKANNSNVGWGYYIRHEGQEYRDNGSIGKRAEVYDGEAKGSRRGSESQAKPMRQGSWSSYMRSTGENPTPATRSSTRFGK